MYGKCYAVCLYVCSSLISIIMYTVYAGNAGVMSYVTIFSFTNAHVFPVSSFVSKQHMDKCNRQSSDIAQEGNPSSRFSACCSEYFTVLPVKSYYVMRKFSLSFKSFTNEACHMQKCSLHNHVHLYDSTCKWHAYLFELI